MRLRQILRTQAALVQNQMKNMQLELPVFSVFSLASGADPWLEACAQTRLSVRKRAQCWVVSVRKCAPSPRPSVRKRAHFFFGPESPLSAFSAHSALKQKFHQHQFFFCREPVHDYTRGPPLCPRAQAYTSVRSVGV